MASYSSSKSSSNVVDLPSFHASQRYGVLVVAGVHTIALLAAAAFRRCACHRMASPREQQKKKKRFKAYGAPLLQLISEEPLVRYHRPLLKGGKLLARWPKKGKRIKKYNQKDKQQASDGELSGHAQSSVPSCEPKCRLLFFLSRCLL